MLELDKEYPAYDFTKHESPDLQHGIRVTRGGLVCVK